MRAVSIDSEAGAYARYRLVRAGLAGSIAFFVVLTGVLIPAIGGYTSPGEALEQVALGLAISLPLITLVVTGFERLPKDFIGFVGSGLSFMGLALPLGAMLLGGITLVSPQVELLRRLSMLGLIVLSVPLLWMVWDWLLFSGWQLAGEGDLDAVRGWRPKAWRLVANFQRQMGMPAFIASMRGGLLIASVYFGSALLTTGLITLPLLALWLLPTNPRVVAMSDYTRTLGFAFAALFALNLLGANRVLSGAAANMARRRYQKVRNWDGRAPILFLRTFKQDVVRAHVQTANRFLGWLTGIGRPLTLDEILLEHASPYGPVIAIGDPNDKIPPLGAARIFVSNDDWQGVVAGLAAASKAIVMSPTGTEGVRWELRHLVETGAQARTIYLASPQLTPAETKLVFSAICGKAIEIVSGENAAIALYRDSAGVWRALSARALTTQSYTVALNTALQAMFGTEGVAMVRARKLARR